MELFADYRRRVSVGQDAWRRFQKRRAATKCRVKCPAAKKCTLTVTTVVEKDEVLAHAAARKARKRTLEALATRVCRAGRRCQNQAELGNFIGVFPRADCCQQVERIIETIALWLVWPVKRKTHGQPSFQWSRSSTAGGFRSGLSESAPTPRSRGRRVHGALQTVRGRH